MEVHRLLSLNLNLVLIENVNIETINSFLPVRRRNRYLQEVFRFS